MRTSSIWRLGLALAALLAFVLPAGAQGSGGNIYGTVTDESGAVLPGATVTLTGAFGTRTSTSGSRSPSTAAYLRRSCS